MRSYRAVLPATVQGIRRYLGSGLIRGIGPKMAERIVDRFGVDTLRVLEEDPGRLRSVPGLGPTRTAMIEQAWEEQKAIKDVMVFLQGVGVSTSLAVRIYKAYREEAIKVVTHEPYRLATDVWGIGFKTADKIAQGVGIAYDSGERVKAGLQFTLSQASELGHCYLPEPELVARASEILGVRPELAQTCLDELVRQQGVIRDPVPIPGFDDGVDAIYLVPFHRAEVSLAAGLLRLRSVPEQADRLPMFRKVDWSAAFAWLEGVTGSRLAPEQETAVRLALTEPVAVLTGGPGCGKSFTIRAVVALAQAKKARVVLAAPTGRAAKRLSELAGMDAQTLHRLLELRPGGRPPSTRTARWRPTWWWSTRPPCSTCCWPTSSSRRSPRGPPAAGRRRRPAPQRRPRRGPAGPAPGGRQGSPGAAPGPPDPGVPPGPAERRGHQRPPHQRRPPAADQRHGRLLPLLRGRPRAGGRADRRHRGQPPAAPLRPRPAEDVQCSAPCTAARPARRR